MRTIIQIGKTIKLFLIGFLFLFLSMHNGYTQYKLEVEGDAKILGRIELQSAGTHNSFVGAQSGSFLTSGEDNAFFGIRAGFLNTAGNANTFLGYEAGRNNNTGGENTAVGPFALANNQLKSKNIALGSRALLNLKKGFGEDPQAGNSDFGTTLNLAIGTSAGQFTNDTSGTGAERNTFVGNYSGLFNTTGFRNAFFGFQSGDNNTIGRWNTCIGYDADVSVNNFVNAGAFGSDAVVNASHKIRIGDANVTTVEGNGWSLPSDGRFKKNVQENVSGLNFLLALRPVTYQLDVQKYKAHILPPNKLVRSAKDPKEKEKKENANGKSIEIQTGFIAQEVEEAAKKMGFKFNGVIAPKNPKDNYGISYNLFVVPIIKGIQEQQAQITSIKQENELLQKQNKVLKARLDKIEAMLRN